jgi:hypothetical protein
LAKQFISRLLHTTQKAIKQLVCLDPILKLMPQFQLIDLCLVTARELVSASIICSLVHFSKSGWSFPVKIINIHNAILFLFQLFQVVLEEVGFFFSEAIDISQLSLLVLD